MSWKLFLLASKNDVIIDKPDKSVIQKNFLFCNKNTNHCIFKESPLWDN